MSPKILLNLIRFKQQHKSLIVAIAPVVSGEIFSWSLIEITKLLILITVFVIGSSIVYIFNDIYDAEKDKFHPVKSIRPIAAGQITRFKAVLVATILLILLYLFVYFLRLSYAGFMVSIYIFLNVLYTLFVKEVAFWELFIVPTGFLLRAITGAQLVGQAPTLWFYSLIVFGALAMVVGKRIAERDQELKSQRKVLSDYPVIFLQMSLTIFVGILFFVYLQYVLIEVSSLGSEISRVTMISSVPAAFAVFLNFLRDGLKGNMESPERTVFVNRNLLLSALAWLLLLVTSSVI